MFLVQVMMRPCWRKASANIFASQNRRHLAANPLKRWAGGTSVVSIAKAQIKREVLSIKFDWFATHEAL